jgi:glycerol uptake facilitator protein
MNPIVAEGIGTMLVILMGNGVVANVVLKKTLGHGAGWLAINFGWAIAVFIGVLVTAVHSGAHLNPAVSIAMAYLGKISWLMAFNYIVGQLIGAMVGAVLVFIAYRDHYMASAEYGDQDAILGSFSTGPAIARPLSNLLTEIIGTFVLIFAVLNMASPDAKLGALDALPVALVVLGLGLSLGGPTGYALNPARDLGPRIIHFLLPIQNKRSSNWSYSWVPILGPILGSLVAAILYQILI